MMHKVTVRLLIKESQKNEHDQYWFTIKDAPCITHSNSYEIHLLNIDDLIRLRLKESQFDEVTLIYNLRNEETNEETNEELK